MCRRFFAVCALAWFACAGAWAAGPVAKISAHANGTILLDGRPASMPVLDAAFRKLKESGGVVWYHRENPHSEPRPEAMAVIDLIIKHQLPVSFSTKPDFSDAVDEHGRSHPRKP